MADTEHPGFEKEAKAIGRKEHVPIERARAILASGARNASAEAKRENPRLKRVPGA